MKSHPPVGHGYRTARQGHWTKAGDTTLRNLLDWDSQPGEKGTARWPRLSECLSPRGWQELWWLLPVPSPGEGLQAPNAHTGAGADTSQGKPTTPLDLERDRGGDTKNHVTKDLCFPHVDLAMLASVDTAGRKREVIPLPETEREKSYVYENTAMLIQRMLTSTVKKSSYSHVDNRFSR